MTKPIFHDARATYERGKKHFEDFDRQLRAADVGDHYFAVDPHPQNPALRVWKCKIRRTWPEELSLIAADCINNLRAALDQATYACAVADGKTGEQAGFPFSHSKQGVLARHNPGSSSCQIPKTIFDKIVECGPWVEPGLPPEQNFLPALNEVRNSNMHRLICRAYMYPQQCDLRFVSATKVHPLVPPEWDIEEEALILGVGAPDGRLSVDWAIRMIISFGDVPLLVGLPAEEVLRTMVETVGTVLDRIEAEARVLNLVT